MSDQAVMSENQTTSSSTPAAGWYPNPQGQGLRWWDGSTWTEHTHEEGAPAASSAAATSRAPSAASTASTSPVIATGDAGNPAEQGKGRVNFVNDHPMVILIALLAVLAVIVVLQVI